MNEQINIYSEIQVTQWHGQIIGHQKNFKGVEEATILLFYGLFHRNQIISLLLS